MRIIGVVTTSRADYGIYRPVLKAIQEDPDLRLQLLVSGMHLSPHFGLTVKEIEADGYEIADRIEILMASDTPAAIAKTMGLALMGFSQAFSRWQPDILLVSGDRYEMLAAALAAVPFNFPIAHMGGGDITTGAIDDGMRHSLTKISHVHFPETEEARRTIIQMGEEPWRVTVSGAPSLENLQNTQLLTAEELESRYPFRVSSPFLLVTYHPVTRQYQDAAHQIAQLLGALGELSLPVIFTMPNADTANDPIRRQILDFAASRESVWCVENLGAIAYFSVLARAAAMVGNSSSGIVESATFKLPVVNVGIRQQGRFRARNVIDTGNSRDEIRDGLRRALDPEFRDSLGSLVNPYASPCASAIIVEQLKSVPIDASLLIKQFHRIANVL